MKNYSLENTVIRFKDMRFKRAVLRPPHNKIVDLFRERKNAKKNDDVTFGDLPGCICICVHGKVWNEGDLFEENCGRACKECSNFGMIESKIKIKKKK